MMRSFGALLLVAAAGVTAETLNPEVVGCAGEGDLAVCLAAEQQLRVHIGSCVEGSAAFPAAGVSGRVEIRGAVEAGNRTILQATAYGGAAVNVTCANRVATLELAAAGTVSGGAVAVVSAVTDLRVQVGAGFSITWEGTLLRADVGRFDGVSVGFSVAKAGFAAKLQTALTLDIGDLGVHLGLPSQIVLNRDGLFFFDFDGAVNVTCPLAAVAAEASAEVYVSALGRALAASRVEVDVCALVSAQRVGQPFVTIEASAEHAVTVLNMSMSSASVRLTGALASVAPVKVEWQTELTGAVALFGQGVLMPARAVFSSAEGLEVLDVEVRLELPGFTLLGGVGIYTTECGAPNGGHLQVTVSGLGDHHFQADATQTAQCGWDVHLSTATDMDIGGLVWSGGSHGLVALDGTTGVWSGWIVGSVMFPGVGGEVSATAGFDAGAGVRSISVDGAFSIGAVSGNLSLTSALPGRLLPLQGGGAVEYAGLHGVAFSAQVAFSGSEWDVRVHGAKALVHGLWVQDMSLNLQGRVVIGAKVDVAWAGRISGQTAFAGFGVSVSADIDGLNIAALSGGVDLSAGGVRFNGSVGLSAGVRGGKRCVAAVGEGEVALAATGHVLAGSLEVSRCAFELPKYTLAATWDGLLRYQALELRDGVLELSGFPKPEVDFAVDLGASVDLGVALAWNGKLVSAVQLFGGSASASIDFTGGALGAVRVSTIFTAGNGLLLSHLELAYVNSCTEASFGTAATTVRLAGAAALAFNATAEYHSCSGAVVLRGEYDASWTGPGALGFEAGVAIEIRGGAHGGAAALGTRTWTGVITGAKEASLSGGVLGASVSFNTSSAAESAFDASLSFKNRFVTLDVALDGANCTGSGLLAVQNVPHLPALELEVGVTAGCGLGFGVDADWTVSGPLLSGELRIPYFGKMLRLELPTVTLQSLGGVKTLTISGAFLGAFQADLEVVLPALDLDLGLELPSVSLTGHLLDLSGELSLTPEGFVAAWEGSLQPFDVSLGAALPELFNGLKGLLLRDVALNVSFDSGLQLSGKGLQFGLDFDVSLALVRGATGAWDFGVSFASAPGLSGGLLAVAGLPEGVVRDVLLHLAPAGLEFTIARSWNVTVGGLVLPRGLSLAAFVGANSHLLATAKGLVPAALQAKLAGAEMALETVGNVTARGLKLVAHITSAAAVNLYAQLGAELRLPGLDVVLRDVALAFELQHGAAFPRIGLNAALDVTLGGSVHFSTAGFAHLSAGGVLDVALPVPSVSVAGLLDLQAWANPFGVRGVEVVLPGLVRLTINTQGLFATQFALDTSFQVGGATGALQIGADLHNFGRIGMKGSIHNLSLPAVVSELSGCIGCLGHVGKVVADVSLGNLVTWFNPDLVNAVSVTVGGVTVDVPAGVNIEVDELNLWSVVRVVQAKLHVSASGGIEAQLQAGKVEWDAIEITNADGTAGPLFSLVLTHAVQRLVLDGRAQVLGQNVALQLDLNDAGAAGTFNYDFGAAGLFVEVALLTRGTPLRANFSSTLSGSLQTEVLDNIVDALTGIVLAAKDAADRELADANGLLGKAYAKLEEAEAGLEGARQTAAGILAGPQGVVDRAFAAAAEKLASCQEKESRCKGGNLWACAQVPGCYTQHVAAQGVLRTAELALDAANATANGVLDVAVGVVNTQQAALGAVMAVVNAARGVVDAFGRLTMAVGGALKKVLNLHSVTFTSPLTRTSGAVAFTADMTVAGGRFTVAFDSQLQYTLVKQQLEVEFRKSLSASWGGEIPQLKVDA